MILSSFILIFCGTAYHILFNHCSLWDISILCHFSLLQTISGMFIFVHKSQCASVLASFHCAPRSEIRWWEGLNNFNKVFPSCHRERWIYRRERGLLFVIYENVILGKYQSQSTGTEVSLSLWFATHHWLGVIWNSTKYDMEWVTLHEESWVLMLLSCPGMSSCVFYGQSLCGVV
jgi:hypothetical protein